MPVIELHQSHYLGERLFDSSQDQGKVASGYPREASSNALSKMGWLPTEPI